jgi:hypothetical protein
MARWIAIGTVPGWDDVAKFTEELKATQAWRVDPRTTITTVFALADGRFLAECHAQKQADFEAWLQKKGWRVESVTAITHLAKTGEIWKVA